METLTPESIINNSCGDSKSYKKLSEMAGGVTCIPKDNEARTEFLRFLQEHEMVIYPYGQVYDFMDNLVAELNGGSKLSGKMQRFFAGRKYCWVLRCATERDVKIAHPSYMGQGIRNATYAKPIPEHALVKMATLRERYQDEVKFFVTDVAEIKNLDPFLVVIFQEEKFVIDKWDEPGFKLKINASKEGRE